MDRRIKKVLILNDDDLNCNCKDKTLKDIGVEEIGLGIAIIQEQDLIIYSGTKGTKILWSKYTKTGIVE